MGFVCFSHHFFGVITFYWAGKIDINKKVLYIVHVSVMVDANIYLAVILDEPEKKIIVEITQDDELISPVVLPFEVGNALSAMYKRNRLDKKQIIECYSIFQQIPVRLIDINMPTSLGIAADYGIYAYDAYYLELAKRYKCSLMTLDNKMKEVAKDLGIYLLEV
jgi:predicted nucleic acid-binding protein